MRVSVFCLLVLTPVLSFAQSGSRAGTWDISIAALYQDSLSVGGDGGPQSPTADTSSLRVKSDIGFGFNFSYNFNPRFALGVDLDYLYPRYKAVIVAEDVNEPPIEINHSMSIFNGRIKGTWNMMDGPLVPFVDFGFGWTNVDSNVADGPPVTGCWWHPWWGYICENFYRTFGSTETAWGGGVGLRYDFRFGSFLKFSFNRWELDSGGNTDDDLTMEMFRLEYGWSF